MIDSEMLQHIQEFIKIKPSSVYDSMFTELADHEGWSNGFMADLTSENVEYARAMAKKKDAVMTDHNPQIKRIIPTGEGEDLMDYSFDMKLGHVVLKGETHEERVNPTYLMYFYKTYKGQAIRFILDKNEYQAIRVVTGYGKDQKLLGLIMPIRID